MSVFSISAGKRFGLFKYLKMRRGDTTTDTYMNTTTSTTPRRSGPEYYDDYLYDDEYSQSSGAADSLSSQRQEVRSTRESEPDHESTFRSIDYEEYGRGVTDQQKPTESSTTSSNQSSLKTVGDRDYTDGPRGDRYLVEERERDHYQGDTSTPYATSEEIERQNHAVEASIPKHTGSIEYEESTGDIFLDKEMDHYENYVESGYGRSKETNANHGDMPHSKGEKEEKENVSSKEGYYSMEGDYHSGNVNESKQSSSDEILPNSHADSREEDGYYPRELFFTSEEHYEHENSHQRHWRPYYYYPAYREPHYIREVSEILRLVKDLHHRQNGIRKMPGGHNRRKDYRSIDRISSFPSRYG